MAKYVHKEQLFDSAFEVDVAWLLETLGYGYVYHPARFVLDAQLTPYEPDFWVPDLRLWIEPRGYVQGESADRVEAFGRWVQQGRLDPNMTPEQLRAGHPTRAADPCYPGRTEPPRYTDSVDYLVLGPNLCRMFEYDAKFVGRPRGAPVAGFNVALCRCEICRSWFFFAWGGAWNCRLCGHSPAGRFTQCYDLRFRRLKFRLGPTVRELPPELVLRRFGAGAKEEVRLVEWLVRYRRAIRNA